MVLIVPLWNWNTYIGQTVFGFDLVLIVPLWNWNELSENQEKPQKQVLIVPLWNWNRVACEFSLAIVSSNRTFMELKYTIIKNNSETLHGSNRTFMELKLK